jgi:TolB-like protein
MEAPPYDEKTRSDTLSALEALIDSGVLGEGSRLRPLLRYLVVEELEGRGERLKGYAIGTDVFGRGADFDPNADSIVRVEVHRLRQSLDHYYATHGAGDRIRFEIPKGSYRPAIRIGDAASAGKPPAARDKRTRSYLYGAAALLVLLAAATAWLALGRSGLLPKPDDATPFLALEILPFESASDDVPLESLAEGLTDELIAGLTKVKALTVVVRDSRFGLRSLAGRPEGDGETAIGIGYVVRGSVQHVNEKTRVVVHLIEARSGALLWAQSYRRDDGGDIAAQDQLVATIVAELRSQVFNAAQQTLNRQDAESLSAWELYIQATWLPGAASTSLTWEEERIALAERALALRPDFGQAHAVLAEKLAYMASVDPPSDTAETRRQAVLHAQRALELAPDDADVMFNVALYYRHIGRLQQSAETAKRALELDPNHALARLLVDTIPFTCAAPPRDILQQAVAYDGALSPDNPIRWQTLEWIGILYMNQGNFQRSAEVGRRARLIFSTPDSTLRHAAVLLRLGRTDDALALVDGLRRNWPHLDPRHFASVTVARLCHGEPGSALHANVFYTLADATETLRRGPPKPAP